MVSRSKSRRQNSTTTLKRPKSYRGAFHMVCAHSHTHTQAHRVNWTVVLIRGWSFPCKLTHGDWKVVKKKTKIIPEAKHQSSLKSTTRMIGIYKYENTTPSAYFVERETYSHTCLQVLTITFLLAWRKSELCRELQGHWLSRALMIKVYFIAANYCTRSDWETKQKAMWMQSSSFSKPVSLNYLL